MCNRLRAREAGLLPRWTGLGLEFWLRGVCLWLFLACGLASAEKPAEELPAGLYAEIETPRGTMVARLFFEQVPMTVVNFVGLAEGELGPKRGVPYYDGLTFHRVVPGFVVQGGDPLGTGEGGPGYTLPDELDPTLSHDAEGILSMANEGPDTNGSQFFITLAPTPRLDFLHSVFGKVIRGLDVLSRIQRGDRMTVRIRREGEAAQQFRTDRTRLYALAGQIPRVSNGPEAPHFFDDPDGLLPTTPPRAKYFGYKLANVDRFTDVRIFARVFASVPKTLGADRSDALAHLSTELGVERRGALAVYWADHDTWDIVIGKEDMVRFRARAPAETQAERVSQLLAAAERRALEANQDAKNKSEILLPNQILKLRVDGVIQELIASMDPRPRKEIHP